MHTLSSARARSWWVAALLVTALPLAFALGKEMWDLPYPISETVSILYEAGIEEDAAGASHSLQDPTLVSFLDPATRSWYRPFYWLTWYVLWHTTHSVETSLLLFRLLEVLTTVLLVVGFAWLVRPRSALEFAAATVAVAIFVGMPGFRENLELPMLMTLVGMLFAMAAWLLMERAYRPWHGPVLVLLAVLAVGYKEQGLVLVPVIVGAWWAGAPGVRRGAVIAVVVLTLAYLGVRGATAGSWQPFNQDVGIGFDFIAASDANERFGGFPYWIYAYNAAATAANVLFSEPTSGVFRIVQSAADGDLRPWQVNHLLTSVAVTMLILWWAVRTWRREAGQPWSAETRLIVAVVLAVAATAALGFNYSRDRLGGMAVMFYALAAFHALRGTAAHLSGAGRTTFVAAGLVLLLVSAGWQLRAIGTIDYVDEMARKTYRDWIVSGRRQRAANADAQGWLRIFTALEPQGVAPWRPRRTAEEPWPDWLGTR